MAEAAAQPGQPAPEAEFRIGAVVSKTFRVFFSNIFQFLAIIIIVDGAAVLLSWSLGWLILNDMPPLPEEKGGFHIISWSIIHAAFCYGANAQLCGQNVTTRQMLTSGIKRCLPVLGALLIAFAFISIISAPSAFVYITVSKTTVAEAYPIFLETIFVLNIALVMIFYAAFEALFGCAVPAIVIRKLGIFASFGESLKLTKGNRWKMFGAFIVLSVFGGAIFFLEWALSVPNLLSGYVQQGLIFIAITVIYHELRAAKGGAGANGLHVIQG